MKEFGSPSPRVGGHYKKFIMEKRNTLIVRMSKYIGYGNRNSVIMFKFI